jgi:hypothetical protein
MALNKRAEVPEYLATIIPVGDNQDEPGDQRAVTQAGLQVLGQGEQQRIIAAGGHR